MSTHDETVVIGRVGRDCEIAYTKNGKAVANLSLATERGWGDNKKTQWWNVSIWGDSGERAGQYVNKGSLIRVAGEVSIDVYTRNDGTTGASLKLNAFHWDFIGGKSESEPARSAQEEDDGDIPF